MNDNEIRKTVVETIKSYKNSDEMTLEKAERLSKAIIEEAKKRNVNAVVCVADSAGNPKTVLSMDDAFIASYDIAVNKAFTSAALKISTSELKKLAQPGCELYGIQFTNGGRIVIFGGGEALYGRNGKVISGLGVSGGTEKEDTELSRYGKMYFEKEIK